MSLLVKASPRSLPLLFTMYHTEAGLNKQDNRSIGSGTRKRRTTRKDSGKIDK